MYLSDDFCKQIFENERKWIDLASRKLLNIYYLNGKDSMKDFYTSKKKELEKNSSNSKMAKKLVGMIDDVLNKIEAITESYRNGNEININELVNLFLIYKLSEVNDTNTSNLKNIETKALEKLEGNSILPKEEYEDDYLYDDGLDN